MSQLPPITLLDELEHDSPKPVISPAATAATSFWTKPLVSDVSQALLDTNPSLDDRLATAAAHLAVDEALLDAAEAGVGREVLRLWQFSAPTAVLGRGSKVEVEINRPQCALENISVTRRCSGGASIVAGPGCLMYSIVLNLENRPQLRRLDVAHQFVMQSLAESLNRFLSNARDSKSSNPNSVAPQIDRRFEVQVQGTCDLTLDNRKFSGNSLRVARNHLLYHGTMLFAADLEQISRALNIPPRQPDYRLGREHSGFITNVPLDQGLLRQAIVKAFATRPAPTGQDEIKASRYNEFFEYLNIRSRQLAAERYCQSAWIMRH